MKRTVLFVFFLTALSVSVVFSGAGPFETLSNGMFQNPRMPKAVFAHDSHNKRAGAEDCSICHHTYDNGILTGESSEGAACADCHKPSEHREGLNLSAAYHTRCKGCHLSVKKGPVVCGECHRRNQARGSVESKG